MVNDLNIAYSYRQGFSLSDDMTAKIGFFKTAFVYLKI